MHRKGIISTAPRETSVETPGRLLNCMDALSATAS
jgi:hypothetical protein